MLYRASAPFITYWLTAQKVLNTKWLFSQIELDVDAVAMLFLNIKLTEGLEVITRNTYYDQIQNRMEVGKQRKKFRTR